MAKTNTQQEGATPSENKNKSMETSQEKQKMETENNRRKGDVRRYKITTPEGEKATMAIGMTRRKQLESEDGWKFEEVVNKEEAKLLTCFKCGKKMRKEDSHIWYHADQDDLICEDCARETKHTDTAYAGLRVAN